MNRQEINKIVKYCCKELNLPIPKVTIFEDDWRLAIFHYNHGKITLEFNTEKIARASIQEAYESIWKYINYKPRYKWEYKFFIVAHELGHYLQYERHAWWLLEYAKEFEKYMTSFKKFSLKKYHNLKIESNANKIAMILLKRAKKKGFKI